MSSRAPRADNGGVHVPPPPAPAGVALAAHTEKLRGGHALEQPDAADAARALSSENVPTEAKVEFLRALSGRETREVFTEFGRVFHTLARDPGVAPWAERAIDVCGTGGDHSGSYNISTTVAFVLAAAGVPVFKHGNRSITSQCGSADFLLANGIPLEAADEQWRAALRELNFVFFFAPAYHPAFKHVAPARKLLAGEKVRTIFNVLGPLLNPGRPAHQLVGVFSVAWMKLLAEALGDLGVRRGLIVHGRVDEPDAGGSLDELSVATHNLAWGVGALHAPAEGFQAADAGLAPALMSDLRGGDAAHNVQLLESLLAGRAPAGLRDTICLNAGAALWVAERATNLKTGAAEAAKLLAGGPVRDWLAKAKTFFADWKK